MNPNVTRRLRQVRRYWWVVLGVSLLAALTAVPLLRAQPTYAATSTLVLSSPNRNPLEDASMITGYATVFNDPATIDRLTSQYGLDAPATYEARMVGASPILTIEAVAKDPSVAQDAAMKMAQAFTTDINGVRERRNAKSIQDTQRQLDGLLAAPGPEALMNPLIPVIQQRLDVLRADTTDQVQELQPRGGVTEVKSKVMTELILRVGAGLVFGVLAAVGLATWSTRVRTPADLSDKTGVDVLADLPEGGSAHHDLERQRGLRRIVDLVELQDVPASTVVAVADAGGARAAQDLAEAIATLTAQRGTHTVLVYTDATTASPDLVPGFNDALTDPRLVERALQEGPLDALRVMSLGTASPDRHLRVSRDRVAAVITELRAGAETVVIAAPSLADAMDAQQICAAADVTVLAVDKHRSRATGVTAAVAALTEGRAALLGAVLVCSRKPAKAGWIASMQRRTDYAESPGGRR